MKSFGEIERNISTARKSLFYVVVFTLINIVLYALNANISFLFSASFPVYAVVYGYAFTEIFQMNVFSFIGIALALLAEGALFLCYTLSRKHRSFLLVAFILLVLDTAFLVGMLTLDFSISDLIDAAFHVLVLFYIGKGVKSWFDMKKLPDMVRNRESEPVITPMYVPDVKESVQEEAKAVEEPKKQVQSSEALGEYDGDGEAVLTQQYNEMEINVCKRGDALLLVINGSIYAQNEQQQGYREMLATVDGARVKTIMDNNSIYLFVNGNMLAQKKN